MEGTSRSARLAQLGRWAAVAGFTVLVAVIGLGVIGGVLGPAQPGPVVASPAIGPASWAPSQPSRRVIVDSFSRRLWVEPYLTGQMPASPWTLETTQQTKGLFEESQVLTAPGTTAAQPSLPTGIVLADMDPESVVGTDLGGTAQGVAVELGQRLYRNLQDLKVGETSADDPRRIGPYPAQSGRAVVTGTLSDGSPERAEIVVLLVAEPDGRYFAVAQIRPDRESARAAFPALDAAVASLAPMG